MRLIVVLLAGLLTLSGAARADNTPSWRIGDDLAGTRWQAQAIKGVPVAEPGSVTLEFIPGEHVRGQAACNRFVGPYASRGDADRVAEKISAALGYRPTVVSR